MQSRSGNWFIAIGSLLVCIGLCFLPAAFGEHADTSMLGAGSSLFGLGALTIALGIYLKAQALRATAGKAGLPEPPAARTPKIACDLCRTEAPVIQCKVHQLVLCGKCLAEHYDFRSCVYAPMSKSSLAPKNPKTLAAKAK